MRKRYLVFTIAALLGLAGLIVFVWCRTEQPASSRSASVTIPAPSLSAEDIWQARWREALRTAVRRLARARAASQEYFASMGQWPGPDVLKAMQLADDGRLASDWVSGAGFIEGGLFDVQFSTMAGAGSVQYRWQPTNASLPGWWECSSADRSDIGLVLPECRYSGSAPMVTIAAPRGVADLAKLNAVGAALDNASAELAEFLETHYRVLGKWPDPLRPGFERAAVATNWIEMAAFDETGQISIQLSTAAGGGTVKWQPQLLDSGVSWWQCSSAERADVQILLPGCRFEGDHAAPTMPAKARIDGDKLSDVRDVQAFRAAVRDDLDARFAVLAVLTERNLIGEPWPTQEQMFGSEPIRSSRFVAGYRMLPDLRMQIALTDAAGGGTLLWQLMPSASNAIGGWWHCSADRPDIQLILPECRPDSALPAVADDPAAPDRLLVTAQRRQLAMHIQLASALVQTTVTEFVASVGSELPGNVREQIRLPAAELFVNPWLERVDLANDLVLHVQVSAEMGGGVFRFTPVWAGGIVTHWTCDSPDRTDALLIIPGCLLNPH